MEPKKRAVLLGVQKPDVSDAEQQASLAELERLAHTLGLEVIGRLSQKRKALATGTLIGAGKLRELAAYTGGPGTIEDAAGEDDEDQETPLPPVGPVLAEVVICDLEMTPTQMRNIETATGVQVLDRTGVILEIFHRHAKSREARLQVELARLRYLAPRLRAARVGGDRQGGGIGAKGAGETAHELDKRRIRDRIGELREQLEIIHKEQQLRRSQRREVPCAALVGYTNAGKSSLMRALTGSEVLVEDKLFATLDTTVRALQPEAYPRILITDTVGFINKLPHDLVASFRSTLDETLSSSLLLFVADSSDPTFRSQLQTTQAVIADVGASDVPRRLILNKVDCLSDDARASLSLEFPDALQISTRRPDDIEMVKKLLRDFFEQEMVDESILVPYTKGHLLSEVRLRAKIIHEEYVDDGTLINIRTSPLNLEWIRLQLGTKL